MASFFSSGFAESLFVVVVPSSPPPVVPPGVPKAKPPVVGGTGVEVPDASGFFAKKLPPNAGVAVEVDAEVAVLSAGLGGSPRNPPSEGVVLVVVGPLAGLEAPLNNVPVAVLVLGDPPKILVDMPVEGDQHREPEG